MHRLFSLYLTYGAPRPASTEYQAVRPPETTAPACANPLTVATPYPPIAALCKVANKLCATTFPNIGWSHAAMEPDNSQVVSLDPSICRTPGRLTSNRTCSPKTHCCQKRTCQSSWCKDHSGVADAQCGLSRISHNPSDDSSGDICDIELKCHVSYQAAGYLLDGLETHDINAVFLLGTGSLSGQNYLSISWRFT